MHVAYSHCEGLAERDVIIQDNVSEFGEGPLIHGFCEDICDHELCAYEVRNKE